MKFRSKRKINPLALEFRITSLQLLNTANAPDDFEARALKKFTDGVREFWELEE